MHPYQFAEIVEKLLGAGETLGYIKLGIKRPTMKKSEAYRVYGRQTVDRWIKEKLIKPIKDRENNGMVRLSIPELIKADLTSNRNSYFNSLSEEQ